MPFHSIIEFIEIFLYFKTEVQNYFLISNVYKGKKFANFPIEDRNKEKN